MAQNFADAITNPVRHWL